MKKVFILVLFLFCATLFACARQPIVAFLKEGTSAGSDTYTINQTFAEDSMFENKFIDTLISSSIDNLTIVFKREFDQDTTLLILNKNQWYSLTLLLNEQGDNRNEEYMPFNQKHNVTMLIESEQDAFVTLKTVCGDKYENSQGVMILINQVEISKSFDLDLGKNLEQ